MVSPSLEKRATLGLDAQGTPQLGYPRPRYVLSAPGVQLTVNSVGARPNPLWVTAFVGDGHTLAGGDGLTTLVLQGGLSPLLAPAGTVTRALTGRFVPGAGEFTVTFDPARYPALALPTGSPLGYSLNRQTPGWDGVQQALAAGPLLVSGGRLVLDPAREGFDTSGSIWRATRQVAFITMGTQTGIAFLSSGTPNDFARALLGAGVSSALRLDSGSSATVYVTGGYLNAGGYLNTVWSRSVPNALIFVPRVSAQGK
jgi:Phosphodiester glycosidase